MPRLILASQSPHRLLLLQDAGYEVEAFPADIDEPDLAAAADLEAELMHLAQRKALAVARRGVNGLILGADTVGHVAGQVFGKPRDRDDALRMLQAISGSTHDVLTGFCLLRTSDRLALCGLERTVITMRPWTDREFAAYLDSGEWIGKCGAYGLRWPNDPFVTRITGSPSNVIGLPLERLAALLPEFGERGASAP